MTASAGVRTRFGRLDPGTLLTRVVSVTFVVATFVPLGYLIYGAFLAGYPGQPTATPTTAWVKAVYGTGTYLSSIRWSLLLALPTATLATLFGAVFSWLLWRTNLPGRRFWGAALNAAFALPAVFASLAWIALLAPRAGLLNVLWHGIAGHDLYAITSAPGVIAVMVTVFVPFGYQLVCGAFASADFADEEAARVHGAGLVAMALRITLPQVRRSLAVSWVLIFAISSQTFAVVLLLGTQSRIDTVALDMYQALESGTIPIGQATMLGTLLLWPGLLAFVWLLRYDRKGAVIRVGTVPRSGRWHLGRLAPSALVFVAGYVLVAILLPLVALVFGSVEGYQTAHLSARVFTLANYRSALTDSTVLTALVNTLVVGVAAATVGVLSSFVLSYAQLRSGGSIMSRVAQILTALSLAVPRLAFSLGVLWCVSRLPGLRSANGSLWLLVASIVVANIGIGMRSLSADMERSPRAWRDAAMLSGANHFSCMTRIVGPTVLPSVVAVWRTYFILAILEIDLILFLYQPRSVTLSVLTLFRVSQGVSNTAYPLVILQLATTAVVLLLSAVALRVLGARKRAIG